jgi:hypothetical protein
VDLTASADALRTRRDEVVPGRPISLPRRGGRAWAVAAVLLAISWNRGPAKTPSVVAAPPKPAPQRVHPPVPAPQTISAKPAVARKPVRRVPAKAVDPGEPLLVKMLTPDPDIVVAAVLTGVLVLPRISRLLPRLRSIPMYLRPFQ